MGKQRGKRPLKAQRRLTQWEAAEAEQSPYKPRDIKIRGARSKASVLTAVYCQRKWADGATCGKAADRKTKLCSGCTDDLSWTPPVPIEDHDFRIKFGLGYADKIKEEAKETAG